MPTIKEIKYGVNYDVHSDIQNVPYALEILKMEGAEKLLVNGDIGNHVNEGEFIEELFWNSGWFDIGHTGILTVSGERVKYRNISLRQ